MNKNHILITGIITALAVLSGVLAASSAEVSFAGKLGPQLHTQVYSQRVNFIWTGGGNVPLSGFPCGTSYVYTANFTESLSVRDPGSTWITFNFNLNPTATLLILVGTNITTTTLQQGYCTGQPLSTLPSIVAYSTGTDFSTRVLSPGVYTLLSTGVSFATMTGDFFATETWTVTTIS